VERYNRPTVVISREGDEAFGSGRSIRAFHLLEAIESCSGLFSRYGGHAHACGFAMPLSNVEELRARLDAFARARLTPADFEPVLDVDAELWLGEISPELFRALKMVEPYGVGNPEPVFAALGVQLAAPPRTLKDKHMKLKLRAGTGQRMDDSSELSTAAILATPRCHPDGAAIRRSEMAAAVAERTRKLSKDGPKFDQRGKIVFDALGWHMAERVAQTPLLTGDLIDIAFSIGHNEHPDYGGLELELKDFRSIPTRDGSVHSAAPSQR
jgi:single-stranded-DNA-specific exonuclease